MTKDEIEHIAGLAFLAFMDIAVVVFGLLNFNAPLAMTFVLFSLASISGAIYNYRRYNKNHIV